MPDGASGVLEDFRQGRAETFEAAFEALFRQHQRAVYGWLLRIVRNPAAAEDLTVETFWRIYRAHARFDPGRGFEAWARTIATHVAFDWLRARRNEIALPADLPATSAADPAISADIRAKTRIAFTRLPPKLRIAAVLVLIEEFPHKQVAETLGISVAAVKVRVFRALRLLRKNLEQQGITA
ncbi:MAG TPA: sigma-70 family RNA polymerase sigma factor [Terracidiphilus sp.]|jgi:RNA polymerase sigma-70 factor (ECF subfamily)|nr:sigma-70 family RNA polymerase sigma factor [Terracidiphilus sp.]